MGTPQCWAILMKCERAGLICNQRQSEGRFNLRVVSIWVCSHYNDKRHISNDFFDMKGNWKFLAIHFVTLSCTLRFHVWMAGFTINHCILCYKFTVISTSKWWQICKILLCNYCQTSNISHTLVGNKIVDHSDVVGASPVSAAPTTS